MAVGRFVVTLFILLAAFPASPIVPMEELPDGGDILTLAADEGTGSHGCYFGRCRDRIDGNTSNQSETGLPGTHEEIPALMARGEIYFDELARNFRLSADTIRAIAASLEKGRYVLNKHIAPVPVYGPDAGIPSWGGYDLTDKGLEYLSRRGLI